jgi:hypothetical protein
VCDCNAYIEPMNDLLQLAETIAARLKARSETIAVAESSTGGLISAALLAVPGASAYFLGGAIVYTRRAKSLLLAIGDGALSEFRPATEPHGCCWRGAPKCNSRRHGDLAKPAPPGRAAIAMAIQPDTLVSRSRERPSGCARWKPAAPTASPICARSRSRASNCWPAHWGADLATDRALLTRRIFWIKPIQRVARWPYDTTPPPSRCRAPPTRSPPYRLESGRTRWPLRRFHLSRMCEQLRPWA